MTHRKLQACLAATWLAVPGVVVGRLAEHLGYAGWPQLAAQFVTTWVCLVVLSGRELRHRFGRAPQQDRPTEVGSDRRQQPRG